MQMHVNQQITNIWKKYGNCGILLELQIFYFIIVARKPNK